jgi:hypothetical protein
MTMLGVTNKPIMLDVIILSVIKLIVVMLSVVTPSNHLKITFSGKKKKKLLIFPWWQLFLQNCNEINEANKNNVTS